VAHQWPVMARTLVAVVAEVSRGWPRGGLSEAYKRLAGLVGSSSSLLVGQGLPVGRGDRVYS